MSDVPPRAEVPARRESGSLPEQALFRRLQTRVLDHLRPFFGFSVHEGTELLRCVADNRQALIGKFCFDGGIGHRLVGDAVQLGDDLRRRSPGCEHAVPVFDQEIRHADFRRGRHVGRGAKIRGRRAKVTDLCYPQSVLCLH